MTVHSGWIPPSDYGQPDKPRDGGKRERGGATVSEPLWEGEDGADHVRLVLDEVVVGLLSRVMVQTVVEVLDDGRWRATSIEGAHRVAGILARELRDLREAVRAYLDAKRSAGEATEAFRHEEKYPRTAGDDMERAYEAMSQAETRLAARLPTAPVAEPPPPPWCECGHLVKDHSPNGQCLGGLDHGMGCGCDRPRLAAEPTP
jgi:hypothetical protein